MKKIIKISLLLLVTLCVLAGCGRNIPEEGLLLLQEEKYEEAIGVFEEAIEEEQQIGEAYRGIGIANWELERYQESKDAFLKALEHHAEKTVTIYNFLGNCEMILENPKGALNYYRLGMSAEDCSKELMQEFQYNEIVACEQLGDFESAKVLLEDYLKEYPEDERAIKEAKFLETR